MRIMLIFPDVNSFHSVEYHPGLASISGYLKAHKHEVELEYLSSVRQFDACLEHIKRFKPAIVGFSSVETQFPYVKQLSRLIKQNYDCLIVCGGVYVTLFPEIMKEAKDVDVAIKGEGEFALLELADRLDSNRPYLDINNLCYYDRAQDKLIVNQLNPLISNLDVLPFPDRSLFRFQEMIDQHGWALFLFNRGCPFNCTYCCNHALAKVYNMAVNKMRFRSVESCIGEIHEVLKNYRTKMLFFGDDIFSLDRKWLDGFLTAYKREFSLPFMCELRCNMTSPELFDQLKAAGCSNVLMGVESGNDFIRNRIMKRGMSREQIFNAFSWAHQRNILTTGTCVIGLPFETKEMIEETAEVCAKTYIDFVGVNIFYPYRGTDLHRICQEYKLLPENAEDMLVLDRKESILNSPHISKKLLQHYYDNFQSIVINKRPFIWRLKLFFKSYKYFLYILLVKIKLYKTVKYILNLRSHINKKPQQQP